MDSDPSSNIIKLTFDAKGLALMSVSPSINFGEWH